VKAPGLLVVVTLLGTAAHGASDCFEPLRANAGWRCRADVAGGQAVDYCLERTNAFGSDPASRFFKLIATGPYPSFCSCRAKGKLPGAAFGEDSSYLCLHPDTDAVVSGKITKRKMAGQTFSAAYETRTVFSCEPDPACDVPPVLDPDLPALSGFVDVLPGNGIVVPVTGGGPVDVAYLAGCGGYTSEAPNVSFHFEPGPAGEIEIAVLAGNVRPESLLVMTPSGAVQCVDYYTILPLVRGAYRAWVVLPAPGSVSSAVLGAYRLED
jgi:hypothetical protein